jgi:subtilase family serine protease
MPQSPTSANGASSMSTHISVTDPHYYSPTATRACPIDHRPGYATCMALQSLLHHFDANGSYTPSDIESAYNLPSSTNGTGVTVAIVDAFGYPTAESDLAKYRTTYGLPACGSGNGCLRIVNQMGGKHPLPPPNVGWDHEQSVDLDMVTAACPNCNIILVQARNNSFLNLLYAYRRAAKMGASIISNSYAGECPSTKMKNCLYAAYTLPGVIGLAAADDSGYWGPNVNVVPAGLPSIISVGGTSLVHASNSRGWSETVWSGTGSGCTSFVKPHWQTDTGCSGRTSNDAAAIGDPSTGVITVYNNAFYVYGGTSVATPILAGVYALAGNAGQITAAQSLYANPGDLNDVTSGSNGSCTPAYICTGEVGYDGPTGMGTPNGIGAF